MFRWVLIGIFICGPVYSENASESFRQLWQEEWAYRLEQQPELATSVGNHDYNDRLTSVALDELNARYVYWKRVLKRTLQIQPEALDNNERINLAIFKRQIQSFVDNYEMDAHLIPLNSDWGFHIAWARMPDNVPLNNLKDYQNYLARLEQIPEVMDQYITLMRLGIKKGMVLPKVVLQGRDASIKTHLVDDVTQSVFYAPLLSLPEQIDQNRQTQLTQQAKIIIEQGVIPAYARFLDFFNGEYTQGARESLAANDLPNGSRYYQQQIEYYTTLQLSADEIHQLGLSEVARIRKEMDKIIADIKFDGHFADFLNFLRTDPQFYARTPKELLAAASYVVKKMDGRLPSLFKTLPRQPYGVAPVPEDLAPFFTTGRYSGASADSTKGGYYWVNTYNLPSRTLYTLAALSLHEAVPGHHLQIALAAEQAEQPEFRRNNYISAFGEGWALYAEWLGVEAGIYETPYEDFGRLTYEMWRACRLVVDTGVHAKGWTRDQALAYMTENTALSTHEITTEVDRYISWPAQALSYKLGELKIKELRRKASQALGKQFDLRQFHDVVLSEGSVPLDVLSSQVERYIQSAKGE